MENDKNMEFESDEGEREAVESAPRARNRTVMLTPEITGQVRARLAQELDSHHSPAAPRGLPTPPGGGSGGGGFIPLAQRRVAPPENFEGSDAASDRPHPVAGGAAGQRGREVFRPVSPAEQEGRGYDAPPQPRRAVPAEPPPAPEGDYLEWRRKSRLVGFLVSYDRDENGECFELRAGRLIVTSEVPSGGNFLFIADESVSPMHAVVRVTENGDIQVLDQLSEHGTRVKHQGSLDEVELSGDKCALGHGDVIRFGERRFFVCVMPKRDEE